MKNRSPWPILSSPFLLQRGRKASHDYSYWRNTISPTPDIFLSLVIRSCHLFWTTDVCKYSFLLGLIFNKNRFWFPKQAVGRGRGKRGRKILSPAYLVAGKYQVCLFFQIPVLSEVSWWKNKQKPLLEKKKKKKSLCFLCPTLPLWVGGNFWVSHKVDNIHEESEVDRGLKSITVLEIEWPPCRVFKYLCFFLSI